MITPYNITKHELIGLQVTISNSENKSLKGLQGEIVDESRNMITVMTGKHFKRLAKSQMTFTTKIGDKIIEVDGKVLVKRPEDRIKK